MFSMKLAILASVVTTALSSWGSAAQAGEPVCPIPDETIWDQGPRVFADCLALHFHHQPIAETPKNVRRLTMFLSIEPGDWLSVTLRWKSDNTADVRLKDETYGNSGTRLVLSAASAAEILEKIQSYTAPTKEASQARDAAEERSPERMTACPWGDSTTIATTAFGSPIAYWGFDCRNFWVVEVGNLIAEKVVSADPDCSRLSVDSYEDSNWNVAVCSRLSGNRSLAARVYNDQFRILPRDRLGYFRGPDDLSPYAASDVHFSIAGEENARGVKEATRALAGLIAKRSVLTFRYFDIAAANNGTVIVTGVCSGYSPSAPDVKSATFTQIWRAKPNREVELVSWRFARFSAIGH